MGRCTRPTALRLSTVLVPGQQRQLNSLAQEQNQGSYQFLYLFNPGKSAGDTCTSISCKSLNSSSTCTTQVSQQVKHVHQCPVNLSSIPLPVQPSKSAGYTCIPVSCKSLINSSTCTTQVGQMVPVLHKQQCPVNLSSVPLTVQPRVSQQVTHVHKCLISSSTSITIVHQCPVNFLLPLVNCSIFTAQFSQQVIHVH